MYEHDERVVLTLDVGGTNFVFSAIQGNSQVIAPISFSSVLDNLDKCLVNLLTGFDTVVRKLETLPVAISFAFLGPTDYRNGVIGGNLPNFPSLRNGVALGPFLQHHYGIPVFIENDGDLFAYGEVLSGAPPTVNQQPSISGNTREYKNLLGMTLGTGFGVGVVISNCLFNSDNGCDGDTRLVRNKKYPNMIAEESVSICTAKRVYAESSGVKDKSLVPKDIFDIAEGIKEGDRQVVVANFDEMGEMAGSAITPALNIVDGLVMIGGGSAGASRYILLTLIVELRSSVSMFSGETSPCVQMDVYSWEDEAERKDLLAPCDREVYTPGTEIKVPYNYSKRIAVLYSREGTNRSIMRGAYAHVLQSIDN